MKLENKFVLFSIFLLIIYLFFQNSFWEFFLVPVGNVKFHDFRCVLEWNRLYENFFNTELIYNDRNGCLINYPKIWIFISKFLSNESLFNIILLINYSLYTYVFYYLIRNQNSFIFIYFYLSGASLLLLERGNLELIIFILIFLFLINKKFLKIFFLFLSIILKIFPVFALVSILNKKNILTFIYTATLALLYLLITFADLEFIFKNTPQTGDISYGTLAISKNLIKHFHIEINHYLISVSLVFLIILIYIFFFRKILITEKFTNTENFLTGSSIYCMTFILNSNHDYRLIFLLFSLPLILDLKNFILKFWIIISLIISLELHRLIFFFGFFGGVLNTFSKIFLFVLLSQILIDILIKNYCVLINNR